MELTQRLHLVTAALDEARAAVYHYQQEAADLGGKLGLMAPVFWVLVAFSVATGLTMMARWLWLALERPGHFPVDRYVCNQ